MDELTNTLWIELRKASQSKLPLFTFMGLMMLPLAASFFMIVLKDPEFARKVGLISAKAHLAGNTADWPTFFSIFGQGIGVGGMMVFSVISSWVFGREFSDGTVKDMLAVPVSRFSILLAKFLVVAVWSVLLVVVITGIGLALAAVIQLPEASDAIILQGLITVAITALMVIVVGTPVAFFASIGRGYLPGLGATLALVALANIVAVAGWGQYFPWSVPGLYAGAGGGGAALEPVSFVLVALAGLAGVAATYGWWKFADQNR